MKKMKAILFLTLIFCSHITQRAYSYDCDNPIQTTQERLESLLSMLKKAFKDQDQGNVNEAYIKDLLDALLKELDCLNEFQNESSIHKGSITSSRDSTSSSSLSGNVNISAESLQQILTSIMQSYSSNQNNKTDFYSSIPTWVKVSSVVIGMITVVQFIAKCCEWSGLVRSPQPFTKQEAVLIVETHADALRQRLDTLCKKPAFKSSN